LFLAVFAAPLRADDFVVKAEDLPGYRIVLPEHADESTVAVALDVAGILKESTGITFPVILDNIPPQEKEIVVGIRNSRLPELGLSGFGAGFAPGEYEIRPVGPTLVIAGGPPRGDINGMYGLCQDHLGCRWLTPGCQHIPASSGFRFTGLPDRQRPAFRYRSTCSAMSWDPNWCVRNRLSESKERCGGPRPAAIQQLRADRRTDTMADSWNPHAFQDIPLSLFDEHPEWFAEEKGKRVNTGNPVSQSYCVTNPEFTRWVADWTLERLRADPSMEFVSITASDSGNHCKCSDCESAYNRVGVSGTYMEFANGVAEQVSKEFTDAQIIIFAYAQTFAPNPVKLHPNIRIVWAPISAEIAHAIDEGGPNREADYAGQLAQWQANASQLGVWYYQDTIDLPLPRPVFYPMQRSLKLFCDRDVDQVFIEMYFNACRKRSFGTDGDKSMVAYAAVPEYYTRDSYDISWVFNLGMEHLHGYMSCRLMWNPEYDVVKGVRDFCRIYYGAAGEAIASYVLKMQDLDAYARSAKGEYPRHPGIHMRYPAGPVPKLEVIEEADSHFAKAMAAVGEQAPYRRRVEMARMGNDLSILAYAPKSHALRKPAHQRFFRLTDEIGLDTALRLPEIGTLSLEELKEHFAKDR
jgi:hypothetical protein